MGDCGEDEFSEFLARKRTHGVLEQETGEFQIDHLKAMKKQASFSLPEPGLSRWFKQPLRQGRKR
ncbi:MAG TPA: hypothetical protein EYO33_19440 [Phycisphaerales bacterium]|nr:hypothetical protein [Phycisphaerales bacterium]